MRRLNLSKASPQLREEIVRRHGKQRQQQKERMRFSRRRLNNRQLGVLLEFRKEYMGHARAYQSIDPNHPEFKEVDKEEALVLRADAVRAENEQLAAQMEPTTMEYDKKRAEAIRQHALDFGLSWDEAKAELEDGPPETRGKYKTAERYDAKLKDYCHENKLTYEKGKRRFVWLYGTRPLR